MKRKRKNKRRKKRKNKRKNKRKKKAKKKKAKKKREQEEEEGEEEGEGEEEEEEQEEEEEEEEEEDNPNSINEIIKDENEILAYPNPSPKWVSWNVPFDNFQLIITDVTGKEVFNQEQLYTTNGEIKVDVNTFSSDESSFIYTFITTEKTYSGTFIVLR